MGQDMDMQETFDKALKFIRSFHESNKEYLEFRV